MGAPDDCLVLLKVKVERPVASLGVPQQAGTETGTEFPPSAHALFIRGHPHADAVRRAWRARLRARLSSNWSSLENILSSSGRIASRWATSASTNTTLPRVRASTNGRMTCVACCVELSRCVASWCVVALCARIAQSVAHARARSAVSVQLVQCVRRTVYAA